MAVTLLVAPKTEGRLEGPVAELAHVLPLERQGRERWSMVKECV